MGMPAADEQKLLHDGDAVHHASRHPSRERVLRIAHPGQAQPLGRRHRPAGRPVPRRERLGHPPRRPGPGAHALQRADDRPHLVVQEGPRRQVEAPLPPMGDRHLLDLDPVERLHRALRLADRRAESREIMPTQRCAAPPASAPPPADGAGATRAPPPPPAARAARSRGRYSAAPPPRTARASPRTPRRRRPRRPARASRCQFSASASRNGSQSRARSACATCPVACTPASVRPAAATDGTSRSSTASAASSAPCTDGWSACRCHPAKGAPSYSTIKA
jgi:hypothetical protein